MRINDKSGSRQIDKKSKGAAAAKTSDSASSLFARKLGSLSRETADHAGQLQQLKEEIDRAGDSLEKEPTIANFKKFRDLLSVFAKKVTAEAYRLQVEGTPGQRCLETITVINKEADALYHLIMREQKDHIKITAQIMKIKGLVVDFHL